MNIKNIKQELTNFLRNQDILTITQRGVTTQSDTGTFTAADTHTLATNPTTTKNIRSVIVATTTLTYGEEYTVNFDTGVISFVLSQTGAYTISYDTGTDSIFPDYPRDDLTINSYPRIAIDLLNAPGDAFGIGGDRFISDVAFTIVVYGDNSDDLDGYVDSIKDAFITDAKNFFYLNFTKRTLIGPTINSQDRSNEIMQKNVDYLAQFDVESS